MFLNIVQDFWSRRWNLTASANLKDAVYWPVLQLLDAHNDRNGFETWKRMVAGLMVFIVSGIMHEVYTHSAANIVIMTLRRHSVRYLHVATISQLLIMLVIGS